MKFPAETSPTTVLFVLAIVVISGCQTMNKQPVDPYAARIPAPPTYSYSQTILGQLPNQPAYTPPGAASTYSPATSPNTIPVVSAPVTPSPSPGPMSSEQPTSMYGSLDGGSTLYSPAAATTAPATTWTSAQPVNSVYNSETASRSIDVSAASATVTPAPISSVTSDAWSTSTSHVVTNVVE